MTELPPNHLVTFRVVKVNKRLWIEELETGKLVYTPPDWMRHCLQSRSPMIELASAMTEKLRYDIDLIIDFQTRYGPKKCPPTGE